MSSVTDVWNVLSMSVRLHGFHVDDAVCVVVCWVLGLIRIVWILPDLVLASGGGTQGSGLKIPGLNLVFVVSMIVNFLSKSLCFICVCFTAFSWSGVRLVWMRSLVLCPLNGLWISRWMYCLSGLRIGGHISCNLRCTQRFSFCSSNGLG